MGISVTSSEHLKLEMRGDEWANVLLVSSDCIFYPYRPARMAQIHITFNASHPEGAGEA